jgi:GTP pyrophosphokinase
LGASALDFAFEIHSEVGAKCLGAKVGGKLVPLSYEVKNGDQIEILTSAKQKPNKDWLEFVKTSKARTKIKQSLKDEKRQVASLGKEALLRKFKNANHQPTLANMNKVIQYFNAEDELDLTYKIGTEQIDKEKIKLAQILVDNKTGHKSGTGFIAKKTKPTKNDELVLGDNSVKLDHSFAKCCNPIPGDKVVGFITVGGEIKIHQTQCKNAMNLMSKYGYRIIKASWGADASKMENYEVRLRITGLDTMGLVAKLTDIISKQLKLNMKSISFESKDGTFTGMLSLDVSDTQALNELKEEIKAIDPHLKVFRITEDLDNIKTA